MANRVAVPAIDQFIAEQLELGQAPGLALTVLHGGEVVHQRGYGYADLTSRTVMTEHNGVVIGSTTKALTCLALMQLADQGLLRLDDPIQRHIPAFRVADEAASQHMTVRQAITHTAGLPPSAAHNPAFLFCDDEADDALERYIAGLAATHLLWPPGAGWVYANDGFVIAGRIIELLSGLSYEDYMRRYLFAPLNLEDTTFSHLPRPDLAVAAPHDYDADGRPYASFFPRNRAAAAAGAQLIMSARDAGRWLQAVLDGGRVAGERLVSAQGYAELVRPQTPISPLGRGAIGDAWYGLGWTIGTLNGVPTVSHGGATITMGSHFILVPGERLAVAVVANSVSEVTSVVAEGVMSLVLGREPARSFPRVDRAHRPDRTSWPHLAGTYCASVPQSKVTGPWTIQCEGDRLFVRTYPGDRRRRPGDIFLFPVSDQDFVLFGRGRTGGTVRFESDGDAVRATWEGVPITKVAGSQ